jgi:outer membrane receptor for ferrienterochelin and colicin
VATLRAAAVTTPDTLSVVGGLATNIADDESPDKEATLDGVEVTGSRAPLALGQAARMVTVLSREDILAAPVQSINDLLKMVVGVDVRQRGPIGAQTDIGIRGSTSEQIIDADQIYVLQQGRVVQHGSPDEVYRQGGVYKDIFDASARSMNVDKIASNINI